MSSKPDSSLDHIAYLSGTLASNRRWHPEQDHSALEQELRACRLARYIEEIAEQAPPLTKQQRNDLVRVLRGGAQ